MAVSPPGWPWLYGRLMAGLEQFPALSDAAGMMVRPLVCDNVPLMNVENAQFAGFLVGHCCPFVGGVDDFPFVWVGAGGGWR
ncbi:MAG: hypothetical protein M5U34_14225 [Chloroflexi bacterium]|nr:hypothetical protein [Chloroflexota bacterium]